MDHILAMLGCEVPNDATHITKQSQHLLEHVEPMVIGLHRSGRRTGEGATGPVVHPTEDQPALNDGGEKRKKCRNKVRRL